MCHSAGLLARASLGKETSRAKQRLYSDDYSGKRNDFPRECILCTICKGMSNVERAFPAPALPDTAEQPVAELRYGCLQNAALPVFDGLKRTHWSLLRRCHDYYAANAANGT